MIETTPHLFCFGLGYSAGVLAEQLRRDGWRVSGTSRNEDATVDAAHFERNHPLADPVGTFADVTHVLISIPPDADGDPALDMHRADLAAAPNLEWVGYLSTTGVYGNTDGVAVDETAPVNPTQERSRHRAAAERVWLAWGAESGVSVQVFRLSGIYGPGSSVLDRVRTGKARRIVRPGHQFSRIHVDDIAATVRASINAPNAGAIYNVCDDVPAEPADVTTFACELLGVEPPTAVPFEEAAKAMTPMGRTFWNDNRLIDNSRIKRELGVELKYPDYKSGLQGILAGGG